MREVVFTSTAVRHFRRIPRAARPSILAGIREHLVFSDPTEPTRNRFRLRRASEHADFELRVGPWRVFYRVTAGEVIVTLLGKKEGSRLIIDGEEFLL